MKPRPIPSDLIADIARECGGDIENFTDGVVQMAAVIECLYHVAERLNSDTTAQVDWGPLREMLRRSRAEFPNIYSGLSTISCAARP